MCAPRAWAVSEHSGGGDGCGGGLGVALAIVLCLGGGSAAASLQPPPESLDGWSVAWHGIDIFAGLARSVQAIIGATVVICGTGVAVLMRSRARDGRSDDHSAAIEDALNEQSAILRAMQEAMQHAIEHQQDQADELFRRVNQISAALAGHLIKDDDAQRVPSLFGMPGKAK